MTSASVASSHHPRRLFKDALQGTGIYLAGSIVQRIAGVLALPITTRFLTTAEFGIMDLLEQTTSTIGLLFGTRFGSALGYFYFEKDSAEGRRSVVTTSLLGAILFGFLATLICRPFTASLAKIVLGDPAAARYFNLPLLLMPATFATEAAYTLLRVENRPVAYTVMSFVRIALQLAGIIVFVAFLRLHVMGTVYSACVGAAGTAAILLTHCFRRFGFAFDRGLFVRMAKYALPLGLGGIAMLFVHVGDRFILPHYRSFSDLGIYVLAYKIGMLLSVMYAAFGAYWNAQVFSIMRREDADTMFARMFTYMILGISLCGIGLIVGARPMLRILAAPRFWGAAALVPPIVIAYYVRSIGDFLRCLFMVENRPGYDAICNWAGAAGCAIGYFALIPKFGVWGAAYATLAAFTLLGIMIAAWTYRLRPYRVEGRRLLKIGLAVAAAMLPYVMLPDSSLTVSIASASASLALFLLTLWLVRFPTSGEWEVIGHTRQAAWEFVRTRG